MPQPFHAQKPTLWLLLCCVNLIILANLRLKWENRCLHHSFVQIHKGKHLNTSISIRSEFLFLLPASNLEGHFQVLTPACLFSLRKHIHFSNLNHKRWILGPHHELFPLDQLTGHFTISYQHLHLHHPGHFPQNGFCSWLPYREQPFT